MGIKPILRWAGGKTWLKNQIEDFVPEVFDNYYEPFVGGGSIFFHLKANGIIKNKSFLSDINKDLIDTYRVIKSSPSDLITAILSFENTENDYYLIREKKFDNKIERAAKFIYLNKTSFNGIYRVNKKGIYNVPYGFRSLRKIIDADHIYNVSELFKNTYFSVMDFKKIKYKAQPNDFIFFDPPYTVAHENNGFIQYNQKLFTWKNQIDLSNLLTELKKKNVNYLMSNASHDNIVELYFESGDLFKLSRFSLVGGNGAKRKLYNEILISYLVEKSTL